MANLAGQAALKRVQAEAKAKQATLQKLVSSTGSNVNKVA
jgi:hypothetical protein